MKRSNPYRLRMILPFLFLITLLSGCTNSSDCTFGKPAAASATISLGLGVNIHFTDPQPGEVKMIADAGFRRVRMDFKWDVTERERGHYDFANYDRLMKALDEYQIRALFILDYGNPLYDNGAPPRTAETRQAFAHWAAAAAKHFSNRGVLWEIYNEPNNPRFWAQRSNVNEYVELALAVGRAFRSEAPNEKLIGPAVSEIDYSFLEACFKAGLLDYWSAVSVHPYRHADPESAALEYCRLRKLIQRYRTQTGSDGSRITNASGSDREIPIISGEWGYSSAWRGMNEERQATLLTRELLTNIANGVPISIWYDWRDDGSDPSDPEDHFGLVRNSYQTGRDQVYEPKPAYRAAKTFSEYFSGYAFQERLPVGRDDDYVLVFSKSGDRRLAAWTTSATAHRINISTDTGAFRLTSHTGESAGLVSAGPTGISIAVSTQPVYLRRSN
ncbi:MAG TPA: cellulase family glycosylhydrolase [Pyrinomonadaceae bacterium]|nr:cellulase family glycosylhydrolase [Pyrinomonadaceae bacterium]